MIEKVSFSAGPLDEAKLAAAESSLGVRLPDDLRRFMLRYNGGRPKPSGFDIAWQDGQACAADWRTSSLSLIYPVADPPADDLVRMNEVTFRGRVPEETLVIGCDAGGNQILLALDGPMKGRILFWCKDHEVQDGARPGYGNIGLLADSFQDFLETRLR